MARYLFVGEEPSDMARRMKIGWADGRLAAVPIFEALRSAGLDPLLDCRWTNLFVRGGLAEVRRCREAGLTIVALGNRVQRELSYRGIPHLKMVHPAARGRIRKRERYIAHVAEVLSEQEAAPSR